MVTRAPNVDSANGCCRKSVESLDHEHLFDGIGNLCVMGRIAAVESYLVGDTEQQSWIYISQFLGHGEPEFTEILVIMHGGADGDF